MSFTRRVPVSRENIEFEISIMATEQDDAPGFNWEDHSGRIILVLRANLGPRTDGSAEAFEVCKLNADFSRVSVHDLQRFGEPFVNADEGLYKIHFSIELTIQDDVLKFELVHKGKKYGEVKTKYQ